MRGRMKNLFIYVHKVQTQETSKNWIGYAVLRISKGHSILLPSINLCNTSFNSDTVFFKLP